MDKQRKKIAGTTPQEEEREKEANKKPHNLHLWSERGFMVEHHETYAYNEFDDTYGNMPGSRQGLTREYAPESDMHQSLSHSKKGQTGRGPKNYQRSDELIMDAVCEALHRSDEVDARAMIVNVDRGIVTLMGSVPEESMQEKAEAIVLRTFGVKDLRNQLAIRETKAS